MLYPLVGSTYCDPKLAQTTVRIERPNFRRVALAESSEEARQFWVNPPENFEARLGEPDVLHTNNFYCPIQLQNIPLIYTLYDLAFIEHPEWTTESNRVACFEGVFKASLYADRIIAISKYTRSHFLRTFPHYPPEHVEVVHLASRFEDRRKLERPRSLAPLRTDRFWLSVSTLEPRKNHRRLLAAYARLKQSQGDGILPLVLAGAKGWMIEGFENQLETMGIADDVVLTGYVDDEALRWLYQNCFAFVYPSLFEGFGLPVLEAMSLGAPVITSSTSSIPEVADSSALLVNPEETDHIAAAMIRLSSTDEDRQALREGGYAQAKKFSWKQSAKRVLEIYGEVVASSA